MKVVKMIVRRPEYGFEKMERVGFVVGEVLQEKSLGMDDMVVVKTRVLSSKLNAFQLKNGMVVTLAVKKSEIKTLTEAEAVGEML